MALISEQDLAEQLKLDPDTLRRWRNEGGGPEFVRLGRVIRYDEDTVSKWIRENTQRKPASS
jgi:predicted site-specific integrase-resolvase